jgi:hypothetical protein
MFDHWCEKGERAWCGVGPLGRRPLLLYLLDEMARWLTYGSHDKADEGAGDGRRNGGLKCLAWFAHALERDACASWTCSAEVPNSDKFPPYHICNSVDDILLPA